MFNFIYVDGSLTVEPSGLPHGFIRHKSGKIETFDFPGALDTYVRAVNNPGEIVGQYDLEFRGQAYSYRREPSGVIDTIEVPEPVTPSS